MDENQVRRIAIDFVAELAIDPCTIVSVRRFRRTEISEPSTVGDEWVVQFQFEQPHGYVDFPSTAIILVDDATGEASLFESL